MRLRARITARTPDALGALAALAVLLAAAPARADASLAEALFQEGKRLMAKHKFADACPKLAESYRLDPGGGTLLSLALCHEHEGKMASAWAEYKDAEAIAKRDNRGDRERIARDHARKIEPKLLSITVTLAEPKAPEGFTLKRDGVSVNEAALGTPFPIDPGEHVFVASATARKTWTKTMTIAPADATTSLEIPKLEDEPKPVAPDPAVAAVTAPGGGPAGAVANGNGNVAADRPPSPPVAGYVLLGAGVLALGAGGFFALSAKSKQSDADKTCPDVKCADPSAVDKSKSAVTSATIATVAIGVGVVAAVVGVILVATAPSKSRRGAAPATWMVGASRGAFAF